MMRIAILTGAALLGIAAPAAAQDDQAALAELLQTPIAIERAADVAAIPTQRVFGKIALDASINGTRRQFIFDTGSPTIISRELADELGLETIATNQGRDANGAVVEMDFAVADTITLGEVTFRNVPVLIHDFATVEMGECVFDGGVIGSEIFPGSRWIIDQQGQEIRILSENVGGEEFVPGVFGASVLGRGYPHPPVIEYRIGDVADSALFDTGSAEALSLFEEIVGDASVQAVIDAATMRTGTGTMGVSAGGYGENTELLRFDLGALQIGYGVIADVPTTTRLVPPTLLGMGLLDRYIVLLDYVSGEVNFAPRTEPAVTRQPPGYSIGFREGRAEIIQLFGGSRADMAGVRMGDVVLAIDDMALTGLDDAGRCDAMRSLSDGDILQTARQLTVQRFGEEPQVIALPERSGF